MGQCSLIIYHKSSYLYPRQEGMMYETIDKTKPHVHIPDWSYSDDSNDLLTMWQLWFWSGFRVPFMKK